MGDFLEKYHPKTSIFSHFEVDVSLPIEERAFQTWKALLTAKRNHDGLFLVIGKLLKDIIQFGICQKVFINEQLLVGKKVKNFQKCLEKIIQDGIRIGQNALIVGNCFQRQHIQPKDVRSVRLNISLVHYLIDGRVENQVAPSVAKNCLTIMSSYVGIVIKKLEPKQVLKQFLRELGLAPNILSGEKRFLKKTATNAEFAEQTKNWKLTTLCRSIFSFNIKKIIYYSKLVMGEFYATLAMLKTPIMERGFYELS